MSNPNSNFNTHTKPPMRLKASFDKTQMYLKFDFINNDYTYYRNERDNAICKIFGRMFYEEYNEHLYPFFPAFIRFAKAKSYIHDDRTEYKLNENEVSLKIDPDKAKASLIKGLIRNISANATTVKRAMLDDLKEKESTLTDFVKTSIETEYEDELNMVSAIEQTVNEFKLKLEDVLKDKTFNFNIKKKIKTTTKTPFQLECSTYTFEIDDYDVPVVIECTAELASIFRLLQPTLDSYKDIIRNIKYYRMFGVPAEERTYKVKGEFPPFDHQWTMWKIGLLLKTFANLSQMGTGKTYGVCMLLDTRLQNGTIEKGRTLYVAPAATLENLRKEFKRHVPHLKTVIVNGNYNERFEKVLDKSYDVKFINYEAFNMKTEVINAQGEKVVLRFCDIIGCNRWDCVIVDECHKIKNPDAQRTANIIDTFIDVPYKIIMSGTITANKLYDIHCPFIFLNGAKYFNSILTHRDGVAKLTYGELTGQFLRSYFTKKGWGWDALPGTLSELRDRLEDCSIRFEKKDCMNLPDKVYETRLVELSAGQQKLYNDLETYLHAELDERIGNGEHIGVTHILALNMKLAEAANGWIYDPHGYPITFPENPKIDAVMDTLEDIDDGEVKCIIWSQFKQDMRMIKDKIEKIYGIGSVAIIDGSVGFSTRFQIQNKFNDMSDKLRFVVCNVLAAGTGIDLIGASYEIYFSNSFRKVERTQSEDRAHRAGMQNKLTIIDIVAKNTIDERVIEALKTNKAMSVALTENLGFDPKMFCDASNMTEDAVINENVRAMHEHEAPEFQKQGSSECMLGAIAHASGNAIDVIRQEALALEGKKVWDAYYSQNTITALMIKYINENIAESYSKFHTYFYTNVFVDDMEKELERRKKIHLDMTDVSVPTFGRGFLIIDFFGKTTTHIVYYENGWIYDSAFNDHMECGKWLAKIWDVKGKVVWKGEIE